MKYNRITDQISISEIGLGCWTLGGLNWHNGYSSGWAPVNASEIQKAVDLAIDQGITHFDNADVYGNGDAERLLAKTLGKKSTQIIISSKVGHFKGTAQHAYEPLHIRHQCEQSLINLNRNYLDIYYFHHGDFGKQDIYLAPAIDMMQNLKKEGKIRLIGLSAYSTTDFLKLIPKIKPDLIQSWANLLDDRFIAPNTMVRTLLEKEKLPFIAFSPFHEGILLGKYSSQNPPKFKNGDHRQNSSKFSKKELKKNEPIIQKLKDNFGDTPESLARIALQFLLQNPVVTGVIPGFRNKEQVKTILAAQNKPLTQEELTMLHLLF